MILYHSWRDRRHGARSRAGPVSRASSRKADVIVSTGSMLEPAIADVGAERAVLRSFGASERWRDGVRRGRAGGRRSCDDGAISPAKGHCRRRRLIFRYSRDLVAVPRVRAVREFLMQIVRGNWGHFSRERPLAVAPMGQILRAQCRWARSCGRNRAPRLPLIIFCPVR